MSLNSQSKITTLSLYCLLNYISIGAFWVSSSWALVHVTHQASSISYLMLMTSGCSILITPLLGLIVDRTGPRLTAIIGHGSAALICFFPLFLSFYHHPIHKGHLYVISLIVNICISLSLTSADRVQKFLISENLLKKTRIRNAMFQQTGLMLGTATAGIIIGNAYPFRAFPLVSISSIVSAILFFYLMHNISWKTIFSPLEKEGFWFDFTTGVLAITRHKNLLLISMYAAVAASTAQVINLTLPAFIQLEINGGGGLFGLCEALWALGGISGSIALTMGLNKFNLTRPSIPLLIYLGICLIGLGCLHQPYWIAIACMILGLLFSMVKTIADALIMTTVYHETIGRVRSNIIAINSSIGIFIYTLPLVFNKILPSTLYLFTGATAIIAAVLIFYVFKDQYSGAPSIYLKEPV